MDTWRSKQKKRKEKKKKLDTWRSMKKERERKKDSHALKKEFINGERPHERSFHPPYIIHYIHTRAHLDLIVWLVFLLGSDFDFAIHVMQVCLFLHTYLKAPHMAIIRSWMKKMGKSNALVRAYTPWVIREYQWGAKQNLFLKTLWKIPSYLTCRVEVTWFMTVPLLNYPRWHDRHFKSSQVQGEVGISLILASYLWKLCFTLVLSPSLRTSKG